MIPLLLFSTVLMGAWEIQDEGICPPQLIQSIGESHRGRMPPSGLHSIRQEQPWQLPREHPEQPAPEEAELTKRSPALQPKTENRFLISVEAQVGHSITAWEFLTSFSKSAPQSWQVNSKMGNEFHLLPQRIRRASWEPSPSPPETSGFRCPLMGVL